MPKYSLYKNKTLFLQSACILIFTLIPLRSASCAGLLYLFFIAPLESTQGSGGTINRNSPEGRALLIGTIASSVGVSVYGSYVGISKDVERQERVLHWVQKDSKGLRRELLTQSGERYQWLLKHFNSFRHEDELPVATCVLRSSPKEIKRVFKRRSYVKRRDELLALIQRLNMMVYQVPTKECAQLRERIKKERRT